MGIDYFFKYGFVNGQDSKAFDDIYQLQQHILASSIERKAMDGKDSNCCI
jgi:hypothetical protein